MRTHPGLFLIATSPIVMASNDVIAPWERHAFDIETGVSWQVSDNTPISYRLIDTRFSWRSPRFIGHNFANGSKLMVRNQATLIASFIDQGPENYYLGLAGSPSIEWWSPDDQWSLYFAIGGGIGVTNSTHVAGGLGQDFTYNWFAKAGIRYQLSADLAIYGGASFMHLSNMGATDPNPGVDALGFTMGVSYSF